jgi:GT2 family glycosyltransferase
MVVPLPSVSIVVVNFNGSPYVEAALESLESARGYREIIVVDNASNDGSPETIEDRFRDVRLIRAGSNLGFAGANNVGARSASGDILVLFNPDAFATPGWLEALVAPFEDASVCVASPKIYRGRPNDTTTIDSAGCDLEYPLGEGPPRGYFEIDSGQFDARADVAYCAGAAFAIRRSTYAEFGGLDESFFCYAEESDLCWRIRMRGGRCVYEPSSLVYHIGSANFGARSARKLFYQTRNRIRMCLQNYAFANAVQFIAYETIHGLCVIAATLILAPYRELGVAYVRAWGSALRSLPLTLRTRRAMQRARTRPDREVLRLHRRVSLIETLLRYRTFVATDAPSLFNPAATVPERDPR